MLAHDLSHDLTVRTLAWPLARTAEVLYAWRRWLRDAPDDVRTSVRIVQDPRASLVTVEVESGDVLLDPLRELDPELDTWGRAVDVPVHAEPVLLLAELPLEAVDAIAAVAGPDGRSPLASFELRHLRGEFAVFAAARAATADEAVRVEIHLERVRRALAWWEADAPLR